MAVSLSAAVALPDTVGSKVSVSSACIQSGLADCGVACARNLKYRRNKTKLKVTTCRTSNTIVEASSCLRTSLGSSRPSTAGFTHESLHYPLLVMNDHNLRHTCIAGVAAVATESCLASDELTIVSAAEQAIAFAAAALNAAKYAVEFHEGELVSESFPSEQDFLKLEKLRLSELVKSGTSWSGGQMTVSDSNSGMSQFLGEITDSSEKARSHIDLDTVSTETHEDFYDFREVLEQTFSSLVELKSEDWNIEMLTSNKREVVAVKSARRKERKYMRERVRKKIEKVTVKTEASSRAVSTRSPLPSLSMTDSVGGFLRTIKKKKLLTSAEEKQLAGRVQYLLKVEKLRDAYKKLVGREPTIQELANAAGVELNAFQRKLWAGRKGKVRMIYCNFGLVITVAKRFQGQGIPFQDLVQEGVLGLIRGIERFKPSLGFKLSTYAHWWIWEAISRAVNTKSKAALIPVNVVETLSRVHKVRVAFSEEHGRPPTEEEVAKLAKLSLNRLRAIQCYTKAVKSADKPVGKEEFSTLGASIVDETSESYQAVCNREFIKQDLDAWLLCLSDREKEVVRLRFPNDGRDAMTLEDIGVTFNVTRERIRQIERIAMQKLKCPQGNHLKWYFETL
ncbi:hypothetical protein O6H91_23G052800 [Diphasiastrum complanatum]|uniref:Uncharacterized protein n=1 Tax=Diphasiastrum complanatum TaxID=34168 RepID=A0ACC2AAT5_DIPCM|nr:hypothetical protein O6H91_23G052800 [Diphasiastrum complanatum]